MSLSKKRQTVCFWGTSPFQSGEESFGWCCRFSRDVNHRSSATLYRRDFGFGLRDWLQQTHPEDFILLFCSMHDSLTVVYQSVDAKKTSELEEASWLLVGLR